MLRLRLGLIWAFVTFCLGGSDFVSLVYIYEFFLSEHGNEEVLVPVRSAFTRFYLLEGTLPDSAAEINLYVNSFLGSGDLTRVPL